MGRKSHRGAKTSARSAPSPVATTNGEVQTMSTVGTERSTPGESIDVVTEAELDLPDECNMVELCGTPETVDEDAVAGSEAHSSIVCSENQGTLQCPTHSFEEKPPEAEVTLLQNQLNAMSLRLLTAQDQIDKLLEEKRNWLHNSSAVGQANPQAASGELRGRLIQAQTLAETYKREKESMVVKYAQSEQKRLQLQNQLALLTKSAQQPSPNDANPSANVDVSSKNVQELESRLTSTTKALTTANEELEKFRASQKTNEARVTSLETKVSQIQDKLLAEQRKCATQNETITRLTRSLDSATKQAKEVERLREREAERLCLEVSHRETQEQLKRLQAECSALKETLVEFEQLKQAVKDKDDQLTALTVENAQISELKTQLDSVKQREDQLSEFTRRLTERHTNLQAEHLLTLNRYEESQRLLEDYKTGAQQAEATTSSQLATQQSELEKLRSTVSDLHEQLQTTKQLESDLRAELADEREQADLIHKRDLSRIKDLKRQLARVTQMRSMSNMNGYVITDHGDTGLPNDEAGSAEDAESIRKLSSVSPSASLHSVELNTVPLNNSTMALGNTLLATGEAAPRSSHHDLFTESERTAWIEKIDRLQRTQLRLTDKVEFLQEHCQQLTEELNKKSRVIQSFMLAEKHLDSAAPSSVDANRARIARTGGLMASLYGAKSTTSQDAADPEVYLEISQKLQACLEDTLFKNITLKENVNTLGNEIAGLQSLITDIRARLCGACLEATNALRNPIQSPHSSRRDSVAQQNSDPPTFCGGGISA